LRRNISNFASKFAKDFTSQEAWQLAFELSPQKNAACFEYLKSSSLLKLHLSSIFLTGIDCKIMFLVSYLKPPEQRVKINFMFFLIFGFKKNSCINQTSSGFQLQHISYIFSKSAYI